VGAGWSRMASATVWAARQVEITSELEAELLRANRIGSHRSDVCLGNYAANEAPVKEEPGSVEPGSERGRTGSGGAGRRWQVASHSALRPALGLSHGRSRGRCPSDERLDHIPSGTLVDHGTVVEPHHVPTQLKDRLGGMRYEHQRGAPREEVGHPPQALLLKFEVADREDLVDEQDVGLHVGSDREAET